MNVVFVGVVVGGGLCVVLSEFNVLVFVDGEEKGCVFVLVFDIKLG